MQHFRITEQRLIKDVVLIERRREHSEGLSGDFRRVFPNIVENDIVTIQRFLDVSRFLYSGGWQVCNCTYNYGTDGGRSRRRRSIVLLRLGSIA